jgi:RimJ/RimL family protein N-acetyltransferase
MAAAARFCDRGRVAVVLLPIAPVVAAALAEGRRPEGVEVARDHPTEFSAGVGASAGKDGAVGPFLVARADDGVVVGEIGGSFVAAGTVEIGYAIVASEWGRGHATAAVRAMVEHVRGIGDARRIVAHAPYDRPASGRVLEKAGFTLAGEVEDEGVAVQRWELELGAPERG